MNFSVYTTENSSPHRIVVKREPIFTAYFLKGKVPEGRLILDGEGGIKAVAQPKQEIIIPVIETPKSADNAAPVELPKPEPVRQKSDEFFKEVRIDDIQTDARLGNTIKQISETGRSREGIEQIKNEMLQKMGVPIVREIIENKREFPVQPVGESDLKNLFPASNKTLRLKNGGEIYVDMDVNLFEADEDELDFIVGLVKHVKKFGEVKGK